MTFTMKENVHNKLYFPVPNPELQAFLTKEGGFECVVDQNLDNVRPEDYCAVVFTPGEDVSPLLYGDKMHTSTKTNLRRDMRDSAAFHKMVGFVPMVGICRGAQFLNVKAGGTLFQHVTHHMTNHSVVTKATGEIYMVTSMHHQVMVPPKNVAHFVLDYTSGNGIYHTGDKSNLLSNRRDPEVIYYPDNGFLCFQPTITNKSTVESADRLITLMWELVATGDISEAKEETKKG